MATSNDTPSKAGRAAHLRAVPTEPDAELVRRCEAAIRLWRAPETTTDEETNERVDQMFDAVAFAIETPATTDRGRAAKARLKQVEMSERADVGEGHIRLAIALARDIIGGPGELDDNLKIIGRPQCEVEPVDAPASHLRLV